MSPLLAFLHSLPAMDTLSSTVLPRRNSGLRYSTPVDVGSADPTAYPPLTPVPVTILTLEISIRSFLSFRAVDFD